VAIEDLVAGLTRDPEFAAKPVVVCSKHSTLEEPEPNHVDRRNESQPIGVVTLTGMVLGLKKRRMKMQSQRLLAPMSYWSRSAAGISGQ